MAERFGLSRRRVHSSPGPPSKGHVPQVAWLIGRGRGVWWALALVRAAMVRRDRGPRCLLPPRSRQVVRQAGELTSNSPATAEDASAEGGTAYRRPPGRRWCTRTARSHQTVMATAVTRTSRAGSVKRCSRPSQPLVLGSWTPSRKNAWTKNAAADYLALASRPTPRRTYPGAECWKDHKMSAAPSKGTGDSLNCGRRGGLTAALARDQRRRERARRAARRAGARDGVAAGDAVSG